MREAFQRPRFIPPLLALALLAPTLAAAAPRPGDGEKGQVHRTRRVVVVGDEGEGGTHMVWAPFLGGGYLGVDLLGLTPELRAHFGAPEDAGVMISRVAPDSPAAEAGLAVGDVITAVDGTKIGSAMRLGSEVRRREEGERVRLDVVRGGRLQPFTVTIRERERQALDLGESFQWEWRGEGEGPPAMLRVAPRIHLRGHGELDPQVWQNLEERLEGMDWEGITERMRFAAGPELEKRIQELEKRLQELEKELERATGEKP